MGLNQLNQFLVKKVPVFWKNQNQNKKQARTRTRVWATRLHEPTSKELWKRGCCVATAPPPTCWIQPTPSPPPKVSSLPIRQIGWHEFANQAIVIDISIYLYKFQIGGGENALENNLRNLLRVFEKHHIQSYFIFEGKPPPEKIKLIRQRCWKRKQAKEDYESISSQYQALSNLPQPWENETKEKIHQLKTKLEELSIQKINVSAKQIQDAKRIISEYPLASYYESPEEADEICALFIHSGLANACMSDDMDMMMYGCPLILRCYQLDSQDILLYNVPLILKELNLTTLQDLQQICSLTGETDYQHSYQHYCPKLSLESAFEYHTEYRINCHKYKDFYTFLRKEKKIREEWISYIQQEVNRFGWVNQAQLILT